MDQAPGVAKDTERNVTQNTLSNKLEQMKQRPAAGIALAVTALVAAFGAAMPSTLASLVSAVLNAEILRVALPATFCLATWVAAHRSGREQERPEGSFPVLAFGERSEGFVEFAEKVLLDAAELDQHRMKQRLDLGIVRQLEGLSCLSRILENRLAADGRPEAQDAAKLGRLADQAIADAQSMADSAYPRELESMGLEAALDRLAAKSESQGMYCRIATDAPLPSLETTAALQIYRMVELIVDRAIRHSELHYILIELSAEDGQLALRVTDRVGGGSFPGLESSETHLLRARARRIKAALDIERRVYGCRLICTAPLSYVASS